ncbi:MAG: cellulose synthase operon protein YhjQ/BcsQ [Acidobacteriota bacterium]
MAERKAILDPSETPEDVATLYSWANLHGAKYRDFSASRAQVRDKARQRVEEAIETERKRTRQEADAQQAAEALRASEAAREAERLAALHTRENAMWSEQPAVEHPAHPYAQAGINWPAAAPAAAYAPAAAPYPPYAPQAQAYAPYSAAPGPYAAPAPSYVPPPFTAAPSSYAPPAAQYAPAPYAPPAAPYAQQPAAPPAPAPHYASPAQYPQQTPSAGGPYPPQQPYAAPQYAPAPSAPAYGTPSVPPQYYPAQNPPAPQYPSNTQPHAHGVPVSQTGLAPREDNTAQSRSAWAPADPREAAPRPAWLSERPDAALPAVPQAPPDTLQGSRDRLTSRWFALKGVFSGAAPAAPSEPLPAPVPARAPALAVFSLAGGVGKTSLVATLGRALSSRGERVLLIDTASYGLLPFFFGARDQRPGVLRTFTPPGVSGDAPIQMLTMDPETMGPENAPQEPLSTEIIRQSRGTSRIIVDLATASGATTRRILHLAPTVLVPVVPDLSSVVSVGSIDAFFKHNLTPSGQPVMPFYILNQFDPSLPLHLDVREVLREQLGDRLLPFALRRAPAVSEALAEGMTVVDYAPGSTASEDFNALAGWVKSLAAPGGSAFRGVRWSER